MLVVMMGAVCFVIVLCKHLGNLSENFSEPLLSNVGNSLVRLLEEIQYTSMRN